MASWLWRKEIRFTVGMLVYLYKNIEDKTITNRAASEARKKVETMEQKRLSCADCGVANCDMEDKKFPEFCMTVHMDQQVKKSAMEQYEEEENKKIMLAAAETEYEGYCVYSRVQETVEFALKMGAKKIGIATCVGLLAETRALTKVLRHHGFEVYGIACKAGTVPKTDIGIGKECCEIGNNTCNPILQAKLLNEEKTDLNIVMGLCVGHDSLFYKYSEAIVTTLVTKDRVTGHNPVAALYQLNGYYKKLLE